MRNVIIDSCALINLINADALTIACELNGFRFFIGELIYDECSLVEEQKRVIDDCINNGTLEILKDEITLSEFRNIKAKYSLGDGETESIALSKKIGHSIATDDRRARSAVKKEVGESKLCGSIYIIRELIQQGKITCIEGQVMQTIMISLGGFLPKIDTDYLCN